MKIKTINFLLIFLFAFSFLLSAQEKQAKIVFKKEVHDFGKIEENGGTVTHKFEFTNAGGSPLVINEVKASCGCTTPGWTRKPVMPGKKGYVSVTFNPANRPGDFNKSIVVRTNGVKNITVLRIKGTVQKKKQTIADRFPTKMGDLRLKSNHIPFVKVKHTSPKVDSVPIVNTSDKIMKVSFSNVPKYIDIRTKPEALKPGVQGVIWAKLDPGKLNDWGFIVERLRVNLNGNRVANNRFTITAKIVEDFSILTPEERKNAPRVKFEETTYNFGTAKPHSKVAHTFKFKNTGKRDLKIRKIRATCGCTTVEPSNSVVLPGESSSFKAILNTGSRNGYQRKLIYFISNDPENPTVRLNMKGRVEK